jgi:hypothetical protein
MRSEHGRSTVLRVWVRYGLLENGMRKSKYIATRHGQCTVGHTAVYHLALVSFHPVSQSADISMCTNSFGSCRPLSQCSWSSFHLQVKQLWDVLTSWEPGEMVQLGGGSGYCISTETAAMMCTTHGPPNLLVLMFEYRASLVTRCYGSLLHYFHCWLLGDINVEPLNLPFECISVSHSVVVQSSSGAYFTPSFLLSLGVLLNMILPFNKLGHDLP